MKRRGTSRRQVLELDSNSSSQKASWQTKYQKICVDNVGSVPSPTPSTENGSVETAKKLPILGLVGYNSDSEDDSKKPKTDLDTKVEDFLKEISDIAYDEEPSTKEDPVLSSSSVKSEEVKTSKKSAKHKVKPAMGPLPMGDQTVQRTMAQPTNAWHECYDENSGCYYYWNTETNQVTWDMPEDLRAYHAALEQWNMQQLLLTQKASGGLVPMYAKQSHVPANQQQHRKHGSTKSQEKVKNKKLKTNTSESEDEKIELITSYGPTSDDDDSDTPSVPIHSSKKKKTENSKSSKKSTKEAIAIGPQLPPGYILPEKVESTEKKAIVAKEVDHKTVKRQKPTTVTPEPQVSVVKPQVPDVKPKPEPQAPVVKPKPEPQVPVVKPKPQPQVPVAKPKPEHEILKKDLSNKTQTSKEKISALQRLKTLKNRDSEDSDTSTTSDSDDDSKPPSETQNNKETTTKEDVQDDEDGDDEEDDDDDVEESILERLKNQAKILQELGGEIPEEIKELISKSTTKRPSPEKPKDSRGDAPIFDITEERKVEEKQEPTKRTVDKVNDISEGPVQFQPVEKDEASKRDDVTENVAVNNTDESIRKNTALENKDQVISDISEEPELVEVVEKTQNDPTISNKLLSSTTAEDTKIKPVITDAKNESIVIEKTIKPVVESDIQVKQVVEDEKQIRPIVKSAIEVKSVVADDIRVELVVENGEQVKTTIVSNVEEKPAVEDDFVIKPVVESVVQVKPIVESIIQVKPTVESTKQEKPIVTNDTEETPVIESDVHVMVPAVQSDKQEEKPIVQYDEQVKPIVTYDINIKHSVNDLKIKPALKEDQKEHIIIQEVAPTTSFSLIAGYGIEDDSEGEEEKLDENEKDSEKATTLFPIVGSEKESTPLKNVNMKVIKLSAKAKELIHSSTTTGKARATEFVSTAEGLKPAGSLTKGSEDVSNTEVKCDLIEPVKKTSRKKRLEMPTIVPKKQPKQSVPKMPEVSSVELIADEAVDSSINVPSEKPEIVVVPVSSKAKYNETWAYNSELRGGEHRGFGFGHEHNQKATTSKAGMIQFIKSDTLMPKSEPVVNVKEEKPDEEKVKKEDESKKIETEKANELSQLISEKVKFLSEGKETVPSEQVMAIQLETLTTAMAAGGLGVTYMLGWLQSVDTQLASLEQAAAPLGWQCRWDRTFKRYYYKNLESDETQWEYPSEAPILGGEEAMELCDSPPPPPPAAAPSPPPPPPSSPPPLPLPPDAPPPPRISSYSPPPVNLDESPQPPLPPPPPIISEQPPLPPMPPTPPPPPPPPIISSTTMVHTGEPLPPGVDMPEDVFASSQLTLPSEPAEPVYSVAYDVSVPYDPYQMQQQVADYNGSVYTTSAIYNAPSEEPYVIARPPAAALVSQAPSSPMLASELDSFYNEVAALEPPPPTESSVTVPSPPPPSPPPAQPAEPLKKKKKTKLTPGLSLKKKGVPSLVAKWQQVQQDVRRQEANEET